MKPLSIIIICLFFFSCKEKKADNDWGKMDLHGKVKTLVEKDYMLDTTGSNKGKHLRWTKTFKFNLNGLLIENEQLDEKNKSMFRYTYTYGAANRIREERGYADNVMATTRYTYDTINHTTLKNFFPFDGSSILIQAKYQYNKGGQLLSTIMSIPASAPDTGLKIMSNEVFVYDKKGNKVKSIYTHSDSFRETTIYAYDEHGNCISEVADTALPHRAIRTTRKFDEKDNLIEERSYEADGSIHSQKKIEYRSFDKAGNWLVQYIHWKDLGTTVIERSIEYYP
ncbi:hypothetical protein CJD36_006870 [Flavipsychrobacter stenotrophus]|uniref:YD repeat-containing protein n=1 Tax=Flavipsychrobacter stenotrophus TaxID=2077091 RepID=A0A2S7SX64_9BACT|nr:hypothetical protein [Flavipsychrobacter stenotrophus]PQJ11519.1 hypothetical protein CJD36_006870 [Flavipsychrobacter stenotrophus]